MDRAAAASQPVKPDQLQGKKQNTVKTRWFQRCFVVEATELKPRDRCGMEAAVCGLHKIWEGLDPALAAVGYYAVAVLPLTHPGAGQALIGVLAGMTQRTENSELACVLH